MRSQADDVIGVVRKLLEAEREVARLRKQLSSIVEREAAEPSTPSNSSVLLRLQTLFEENDRVFSTAELQTRFAESCSNSIRTLTARLAREGVVEKVGRGLYRRRRHAA